MTKKLLTERFQELAGIKSLYEQEDGTDNVYSTLMGLQTDFGDLLGIAESLLKNHEEGKDPSEYDRMIGGDVENHPAWPNIKNTLANKELYMFFLFIVGGFQNVQAEFPFGEDGDVERVINYYLDMIAEQDFDANLLGSNFDPKMNVKELGSGDIKQDRDILLRLMTSGNMYYPSDIPVSGEEMYKELNSGTLNSSTYVRSSDDNMQGINKVNKGVDTTGKSQDRQGNPIDYNPVSENLVKRKKLAESVLKMTKKLLAKRK